MLVLYTAQHTANIVTTVMHLQYIIYIIETTNFHIYCFDQELIPYHYPSCCSCWAILFKKA